MRWEYAHGLIICDGLVLNGLWDVGYDGRYAYCIHNEPGAARFSYVTFDKEDSKILGAYKQDYNMLLDVAWQLVLTKPYKFSKDLSDAEWAELQKIRVKQDAARKAQQEKQDRDGVPF